LSDLEICNNPINRKYSPILRLLLLYIHTKK
jgi:hypothetical protein